MKNEEEFLRVCHLHEKLNCVAALLGKIKEGLALDAKENMKYSNPSILVKLIVSYPKEVPSMVNVKPLKAFLSMSSFKMDRSNNL